MSTTYDYNQQANERTEIKIESSNVECTCPTCRRTMTPSTIKTNYFGTRYDVASGKYVPKQITKCSYCSTIIANPPPPVQKKKQKAA